MTVSIFEGVGGEEEVSRFGGLRVLGFQVLGLLHGSKVLLGSACSDFGLSTDGFSC